MAGIRCPFCDNDPFDYVDNGLGMVPVAVTCCHLGRDYWDDDGDEITKKAGDEITGSRVTIARLRVLNEELVGALTRLRREAMLDGLEDKAGWDAWLYAADVVLAKARAKGGPDAR